MSGFTRSSGVSRGTRGRTTKGRVSRAGQAVAGTLLLLATAGVGTVAGQDAEPVFHTTAGPLTESEVGDVLAHHHMFVEFSPAGIGRRPDIVKSVADRAGLPTMLVTGIYREPFMPDWVYDASVDEVADFLRQELNEGVGDTGVPAGLIKVSQNATGMTLTERKVLEAACIVGQETGAAIASHIAAFGSTAGPTALAVIDALEGYGCPLEEQRFIWVHAGIDAAAPGTALEVADMVGADAGFDYLLEALDRGAWVSLDSIGSPFWGPTYGDYAVGIDWIERLAEAGYEDRIIIGSDTGWFDPGQPAGFELEQVDGVWTMAGTYAGDYSQIPAEFVPAMQEAGFSEELVAKLMHDNPWNAYSR